MVVWNFMINSSPKYISSSVPFTESLRVHHLLNYYFYIHFHLYTKSFYYYFNVAFLIVLRFITCLTFLSRAIKFISKTISINNLNYNLALFLISIHVKMPYPILSFFPSFSLPDMLCDPTDLIWRKETPFEAMIGRTAPASDGLLAEVFWSFPQL